MHRRLELRLFAKRIDYSIDLFASGYGDFALLVLFRSACFIEVADDHNVLVIRMVGGLGVIKTAKNRKLIVDDHELVMQLTQRASTAGELDVNSLVDTLELPGPRVSQHLGLMRLHGIVEERRNLQHVKNVKELEADYRRVAAPSRG